MYKVKQKESATSSIKYLELRENEDGGIELVCHTTDEDNVPEWWIILVISQNGKIEKINDVSEECGFKLDSDGAVIIS